MPVLSARLSHKFLLSVLVLDLDQVLSPNGISMTQKL